MLGESEEDMKCKKVIDGCLQGYDISEITIIDGYKVLYSGSFDHFYKNCDASMYRYRNEILKRIVLEKQILNSGKLFLFSGQAVG